MLRRCFLDEQWVNITVYSECCISQRLKSATARPAESIRHLGEKLDADKLQFFHFDVLIGQGRHGVFQ